MILILIILIAVIILILGIIAAFTFKRQQEEINKTGKFPEGHFVGQWMGIGIALGAGIGVPIGLAIGNPGFFGMGLPIGLAIGSAIGAAKEKKAKEEGRIRPLTEQERMRKKKAVYLGLGVLISGIIVGLAVFMLR